VKQSKRIDEEKNSAVAQMKLSVKVKPEIEATNLPFVAISKKNSAIL